MCTIVWVLAERPCDLVPDDSYLGLTPALPESSQSARVGAKSLEGTTPGSSWRDAGCNCMYGKRGSSGNHPFTAHHQPAIQGRVAQEALRSRGAWNLFRASPKGLVKSTPKSCYLGCFQKLRNAPSPSPTIPLPLLLKIKIKNTLLKQRSSSWQLITCKQRSRGKKH